MTFGKFNIIDKSTLIGQGTVIRNYIEIRQNTQIGHDCYIDSRVNISGDCKIGNNVTLRYGVILAKGCEVGDNSYIAPRVMTNNLDSKKNAVGGAKIGADCFIGTHAILQHGITICDRVIIGAGTIVLKDITEPGIYVNAWVDGSLKIAKLHK